MAKTSSLAVGGAAGQYEATRRKSVASQTVILQTRKGMTLSSALKQESILSIPQRALNSSLSLDMVGTSKKKLEVIAGK
jgi:hypothetical protein